MTSHRSGHLPPRGWQGDSRYSRMAGLVSISGARAPTFGRGDGRQLASETREGKESIDYGDHVFSQASGRQSWRPMM